MTRITFATVLAVPLLSLSSITATAQAPQPSNAQRALQWLQCTQQQPNGQIGSGGNAIARSAEVALGMAASGQPASAMRRGTVSLADFLKAAVSQDVGTNGELLLARASQADAGPTAALADQLQLAKANGEYGADIFSDALAILGLRAAGQPVATDAITFLKDQQKSDGGWSFDNADQYGTDSNTTALVVQALISAEVPVSDAAITNGFKYLQSVFQGGGFGNAPAAGPDANSDELAIFTIVAAHLQNDSTWGPMLTQGEQYLAAQQVGTGSDAGAIASAFSKLFATTLAPSAFLLQALIVHGVSDERVPLLACPAAAATSVPTVAPSVSGTPRAVPQLAQTGAAHPLGGALGLLALGFFLAAVTVWRRRTT
jgi:hypothetical protein